MTSVLLQFRNGVQNVDWMMVMQLQSYEILPSFHPWWVIHCNMRLQRWLMCESRGDSGCFKSIRHLSSWSNDMCDLWGIDQNHWRDRKSGQIKLYTKLVQQKWLWWPVLNGREATAIQEWCDPSSPTRYFVKFFLFWLACVLMMYVNC